MAPMIARIPDSVVLTKANLLTTLLKDTPSSRDDRAAYDAFVTRIKAQIVSWGGAFRDDWNGARLSLGGFRATATSGFLAACHNWIAQVRAKAVAGVTA